MPGEPYDPERLEAAAIALAEDCTRLWIGGNHAPAWREVHEDVREEYRRQVRLMLDAMDDRTPRENGAYVKPCPPCKGTGSMPYERSLTGVPLTYVLCRACRGTGRSVDVRALNVAVKD